LTIVNTYHAMSLGVKRSFHSLASCHVSGVLECHEIADEVVSVWKDGWKVLPQGINHEIRVAERVERDWPEYTYLFGRIGGYCWIRYTNGSTLLLIQSRVVQSPPSILLTTKHVNLVVIVVVQGFDELVQALRHLSHISVM
jgi:hypothetical protein